MKAHEFRLLIARPELNSDGDSTGDDDGDDGCKKGAGVLHPR